MERAAVVAFSALLLVLCLFWVYGYIRRRFRRPSGAPRQLPTSGEDN